ncbi:MAG: hypothetical protein WD317_03115 [Balneolaceae bacterium]
MRQIAIMITVLFVIDGISPAELYGQIEEPDLRGIDEPKTAFDDNVRNGISLNVIINNYGFGAGVEFKRVFAPNFEGTLTLRAAGLRDVSEQTFTDFFFGQQIIPNKYKRGFSFPMTVGVRQRLFARQVDDNYRFYISGDIGPVLAYTYPYFDDIYDYGYRLNFPNYNVMQPVNDIFTGLGDGTWHLGLAGELRLSMDIVENFARLSSIQFGYMFYYFDEGLQLMQPNQPIPLDNPEQGEFPYEHTNEADPIGSLVMQPFFDDQRFFGTPQISFIFGRMW